MHQENEELNLQSSGQGYVQYCRCCDYFQIGLGNAVIVLDRKAFNELHDSLLALNPDETPERELPNGKTHLIKTSCQSFMAMEIPEVKELQELLEGAMAELQVQELLQER